MTESSPSSPSGTSGPHVPVAGVALTAVGVAVIRATESARPDRLYDDPFAADFVAAARADFARLPGGPERWARVEALAEQFFAGRSVGVRLVDDRVAEAVERGLRQIVVVGAGLDTRAFRMGLPPEVTVFELDLPELFAFKEPVLRAGGAVPTCARRVIPVDLRADWVEALRAAGFRDDLPTHWVDEGALPYLPPAHRLRVYADLTACSAPGSRFGTGRFAVDPHSPAYTELRALVTGDGAAPIAPEESAPPLETWLAEHGWRTGFHAWDDLVAPLGRPVLVGDPAVGLVLAERT
ncbi:SAM-dependent methyltransferase [Nocardia thailandica]|uniref:S-adenosyl-L-methionine-dependent methyltransferase n=1 Tax=Nocardia thailandica TaxID=257275 RepID=A0ABW6PRN2_9NOCA